MARERPYHHGDLKRTLLETAEQMLQAGRHRQFTLREIARRAGVSHTAPYKHFRDKNALMSELAMVGFDRLRGVVLAAARSRRPRAFRDAFFDLGRAYVRFGEAQPHLYRLMFGQDARRDTHLTARALEAFGVVIELLDHGKKEGVLRKRLLWWQAAAWWASLHGITMLVIDRVFVPENVGQSALDEMLSALLEGVAL